MTENEWRRPYGRALRSGVTPHWIASGETTDFVWRVALGQHSEDHLEVVIDLDRRDASPRSTAAFGTPVPLPFGHSASVSGAADRLQVVVGVVGNGTATVEIEMSDGTTRDARLIRLDQDDVAVDLYACEVDADQMAVAYLTYTDATVHRFPFGAP